MKFKRKAMVQLTVLAAMLAASGNTIGWTGYQGSRIAGTYSWGWPRASSNVFNTYAEALEWTKSEAAKPGLLVSNNLTLYYSKNGADYYGHPLNVTNDVPTTSTEPRYCTSWPPNTPGAVNVDGEHVLYGPDSYFAGLPSGALIGMFNNCLQSNNVWYRIGAIPLVGVSPVTLTQDDPKNLGATCTQVADPINYTTGNSFQTERDVTDTGLNFVRYYNSRNISYGTMGFNWRHGYDKKIDWMLSAPNSARVVKGDGKILSYTLSNGAWSAGNDVNEKLYQITDVSGTISGWQLVSADGRVVEQYGANGQLQKISRSDGTIEVLTYSDSATPSSVAPRVGLLISVSNQWGDALSLNYDSSSRVVAIIDQGGRTTNYTYDSASNIATVTYPDGKNRKYLYEKSSFPHALTGLIDENGIRLTTWDFDATGRAISSEHAGTVDKTVLTYTSSGATTVVDALGASRSYPFTTINGLKKSLGNSQPGGSGCAASSNAITYDGNGNVASRTDFNGVTTTYQHDLARNLETQRVEAAGTAVARTISTQWHPTFALPIKIASPKKLESFSYDNQGNLLSRTEQATTDSNGAMGFNATATGSPRTWSYTYNPYGQVLTMTDPRGAVTQYGYDTKGNLIQITNALNHVTVFSNYDAYGHVGQVTEPGGVVTTYRYDLRGRLVESAHFANSDVTNTLSKILYQYDAAGSLTQVTLPDGSSLSYGYDAAHRLTTISDGLGNQIAYTLDNAGNQTQVKVTDPGGILARQQSMLYDQLGRLQQTIGMAGQSTIYLYDANGNLTESQDALNRIVKNQYDPLNRLIQQTDPLNGVAKYGYDLLDQLTSVTDPRNLLTSYTVDGLGNQTQLQSPDTGATSYSYDAAGNLLQKTDARNSVANYQYDLLGRLTTVTYADQTITHSWDSPVIGKLGKTVDQGGTTQYGYDSLSRLSQVYHTIPPAGNTTYPTLSVGYAYDAAGRLVQQMLPSGQVLVYQYQNNLLTAITLNGVALVSNIQYQPFGGLKSYLYNGTQQYVRNRDSDGRVSSIQSSAQSKSYTYDAADRVTGIADGATASRSQNYSYDALSRLTQSTLGTSTWGYGYDANGNRLHASTGSSITSYQYGTTSNRLNNVGAAPLTYDAAGHQLTNGTWTETYDAAGRLQSSAAGKGNGKNKVTVNYRYAANGLRMVKGTTRYMYDQWGHLLGEYTLAGVAQVEYVWLGDEVVAMLKY